jgi:hypothetical protein
MTMAELTRFKVFNGSDGDPYFEFSGDGAWVLYEEAAAALKAAEAHADDILEKYEARITELEAERDDALKAVVENGRSFVTS